MKQLHKIILGTAFLAATFFTFSCKKTTDPGPAGADGKDGGLLLYRQAGTTLNLSGNYLLDNASFNNSYDLFFFSNLIENSMAEDEVTFRHSDAYRTSETAIVQSFHITRYDSLNNSTLKFVLYKDYLGNVNIEKFSFDVVNDITDNSYKRIVTYYNYSTDELDETKLNSDGNSFEITNWNYNSTTRVLSFDFNGILNETCNSTQHELTLLGSVKANLKRETYKMGQE